MVCKLKSDEKGIGKVSRNFAALRRWTFFDRELEKDFKQNIRIILQPWMYAWRIKVWEGRGFSSE